MRDATERITAMRHLGTRATVGIACAALTLTAASCGTDSGDDSSSTPSGSSSSAVKQAVYDNEHVYTEAKKVIRASDEYILSKPIPKNAKWASSAYRKAYNDQVADDRDMEVSRKGKVTTTGIEPAESNPDAPGGWDLTMYVCSTSTVRIYDKDGNDVTADLDGKPLPANEKQSGVDLISLTTPDSGKTWQIENVQALSGEDAEAAACAA